MNDFYYELAVQAVDVRLRHRHQFGGLLKISFLHEKVAAIRGQYSQQVSPDDVERAIGTLGVLGNGYRIVKLRGQVLVQSVPCELNDDHKQVLELAQTSGFVGA